MFPDDGDDRRQEIGEKEKDKDTEAECSGQKREKVVVVDHGKKEFMGGRCAAAGLNIIVFGQEAIWKSAIFYFTL